MRRILVLSTAFLAVGAWAGALLLQVTSTEANPEAKGMHAVLVADSTACHEPAKSIVTASVIRMENGQMQRTQLQVAPLKDAGTFAVIGSVPAGSVIEVTVSNPEYKNYQPRVLLRNAASGVQWSSLRRFYSTPPSDSDFNAMLGAAVD
jgi:hypothetical protein